MAPGVTPRCPQTRSSAAVRSRRGRRAVAAVAGVVASLVSLAPAIARADPRPPSLALDYRVTGDGCPTEAEFRSLVAARLGSDPFADGLARVLTVHREKTPRGVLEVRVTLPATAGGEAPSKVLRGSARECKELVERAALAVALVVEEDPPPAAPPAPAAPAEPVAESAEPPPTPASAPAPAPIPAPAPTPPFRVGLGGAFHAGGPATHAGAALDVVATYRVGLVSFGLLARAVLPTTASFPFGDVATTYLGAGPIGCLGGSRFEVCAPVTVGAVLGAGEAVRDGRSDASPFVTIGLRPALRLVQRAPFDLGLFAEGYVAPARTAFVFRDGIAFTTEPVGALVGLEGRIGLP